jgi:hypothetical protein
MQNKDSLFIAIPFSSGKGTLGNVLCLRKNLKFPRQQSALSLYEGGC